VVNEDTSISYDNSSHLITIDSSNIKFNNELKDVLLKSNNDSYGIYVLNNTIHNIGKSIYS